LVHICEGVKFETYVYVIPRKAAFVILVSRALKFDVPRLVCFGLLVSEGVKVWRSTNGDLIGTYK
jgi:hypothetical protein